MTSDFSVNMNEYLPLRDVVFNTLRQAILKGELKPGERLMEIALAERLGAVSYTHLGLQRQEYSQTTASAASDRYPQRGSGESDRV